MIQLDSDPPYGTPELWKRQSARARAFRTWKGKEWWHEFHRQRVAFGKWLCKRAENGKRKYWSPMRYVSQLEIDEWRDYRRQWDDRPPYPYVWYGDGRNSCYTLSTPDYYRVEYREKPSDNWYSVHKSGFPTHHRTWEVRFFENHVYPEKIEKFMDYYATQVLDDDRKREEQWLKDYEERRQQLLEERGRQERVSRTYGITPDVETTAFFQALATGGCVNNGLR